MVKIKCILMLPCLLVAGVLAQDAPVQAPNFGFIPCSTCAEGEIMLQTGAIVPNGTLSFATENITCMTLELKAVTSSFSLFQCGELFASNASDTCGCSAAGAAPTVAAPSTIVSTATPTEMVVGSTPTVSPNSNLAPVTETAPTPMSSVEGEVMVNLKFVPEKMIDVVIDSYLQVMTSFYGEFLKTNDSSSILNVSVVLLEQNLQKDSVETGRLLQGDNTNSSIILLPLDTLLKVKGLTQMDSNTAGESLNSDLVQVMKDNEAMLISSLQQTQGIVQLYFSNVSSATATDPTTIQPPVTVPTVPSAPAPQVPTAPVPAPTGDGDLLSTGATVGVMIGVFGFLIGLLLIAMSFQKTKPVTISHDESTDRNTVVVEKHTDPFAPREGKTLIWKNVNMTLAGAKNEPNRDLLKDVWGEVPSKETTAIMGPSGAGKSSLLNILAGRARSHGRLTVQSDIRLNNYSVDPTNIEVRQYIAFVAQDDSLQVTSTPREAIRFSAKLRLSSSLTEDALDQLTQRVLNELGLKTCADTIVGGALIKGISGGERKRTSVGVELVTKPSLIYLDEPTSGLDSFSAVQLCQVLKKVANAGASVLFTIHQPSSEIFNSFDRLILLNKGRVMYQGSVQNVPSYFGDRGHPNPPNYNPADWVMQVAQSIPLKELDAAGFFPNDDRNIGDAFHNESGQNALGITLTRRSKHDSRRPGEDLPPPGIATQVVMLFDREIKNLKRDVIAIVARFGFTIFLSTLIGVIFFNVGETNSADISNLQSHFGALVMVMLTSMFGTAQPALLSFPEERPVFLREYSTNHYSVLSYFLSRFTMEAFLTSLQILVLAFINYFMIGFQANIGIFYSTIFTLAMASTAMAVFLGCSVEDPKLATEMMPLLFVPQMLFAGFFVPPYLIPPWLRWARYLCTLTYAIRIMLVAEFSDCGPDPVAIENCNTLLTQIEADDGDTWWNWLVLLALFAAFRLLALFLLQRKATKFL